MRKLIVLLVTVLVLCVCAACSKDKKSVATEGANPTELVVNENIPPKTLRISSTKDKGLNDYQTIEVKPEIFFAIAATEQGDSRAIRSTLLIEDGKMFFGSENNEFRALDIETAEQKWLYMSSEPAQTLPVYADGKVIFNAANTLYILNAADGAELFKIEAEPDGGKARTSNAANYAYNDTHTAVADGKAYFAVNSGNVYGVDINTGEIILEYKTDKPGNVASGVNYYDGKLYFTDAAGFLRCINASSGEEIFATAINDRVYTPMTFDEGKIYLGGRSCKFYCVDAVSGKIIWSSYSADITTWFSGGSVVIDDIVYAGTSDEHMLPSFNKNTGEFNRIYPTGTNMYTKPALHGKNIVIAASDVYYFNRARIMEFDTANNRKLWQAGMNDSVLSSPVVYDGAVYFGSDSGKIYRIVLP